MNWTTEKPAEPGFYWAKFPDSLDTRNEVIEILKNGTVLVTGSADGDWGVDVQRYWPEKLEPPKD